LKATECKRFTVETGIFYRSQAICKGSSVQISIFGKRKTEFRTIEHIAAMSIEDFSWGRVDLTCLLADAAVGEVSRYSLLRKVQYLRTIELFFCK